MSSKSDSAYRGIRGFILAAGYGTRLLPLTKRIPKALIPFMDGVLSDGALSMFRRTGIPSVGINAHHHRDQIEAYAKRSGLALFCEPEILGTGGYLLNLGDFFDRPLLVANCDAIWTDGCETMDTLVPFHLQQDVVATLVLRLRGNAVATGISLEGHRIVEIGEGPYMFTGMYMVSPEVLPLIETPDIVPVFRRLATLGRLGAVVHQGPWFDAGTREGLIAAHQAVCGKDTVVYPDSVVHPSAHLVSSVVYPGCRIEVGARVEDSVLMNVSVPENEEIKGEIRG